LKNTYIFILLTIVLSFALNINLYAQSESKYLVEKGEITYTYTGSIEGTKKLVFSDFGNRVVVFSNLTKTSTFYSITTVQTENVIEYLKESLSYHFNLDTKRGQIINYPIDVLAKTLGLKKNIESYPAELESIDGELIGSESIQEKECEIWSVRSKKLWIWKGLLLKMESSGMGKKYTMEATKVELDKIIPEEVFNFPEGIPIAD